VEGGRPSCFQDCSCIVITLAHTSIIVRKLFRDKRNGHFLCSSGEWTPLKHLACNFLNNDQLELRNAARGSKDVEWLYVSDDPHSPLNDFTIDIPPLVSGQPKRKKQ
jgi:hypothetical protein